MTLTTRPGQLLLLQVFLLINLHLHHSTFWPTSWQPSSSSLALLTRLALTNMFFLACQSLPSTWSQTLCRTSCQRTPTSSSRSGSEQTAYWLSAGRADFRLLLLGAQKPSEMLCWPRYFSSFCRARIPPLGIDHRDESDLADKADQL